MLPFRCARRPRFLAVAATALFLGGAAAASAARAQVTVTLTPDMIAGGRGDSLVFSAILTNTTQSDLFLNDLSFTLAGAAASYLTPDTNVFFSSVDGILSPGQPYSGAFFGIDVASFTPDGTYSGTVTLLGGSTGPGDTNPISAATTFNVAVNMGVVPEPGTLGLLAAGGGACVPGLVLTRRRRGAR